MTRSLTSSIKTELATNDIRPVHLITIGFSTPVNITDCLFSLTSSVSGSSVTYNASDFIMGVSDFTEETDVNLSPISITLSGADQTFISTVLNENVITDTVTIFRGFLDDNSALIADPFLLYKGTIDNFAIQEIKYRHTDPDKFKEAMNKKRMISIIIVILSSIFLLFNFESFPWVGIFVAIFWSVYNLLRKKIDVDTDIGLFIESLFALPLALSLIHISEPTRPERISYAVFWL